MNETHEIEAVFARKADNMLRHSKRLTSLHKLRGKVSRPRDFSSFHDLAHLEIHILSKADHAH